MSIAKRLERIARVDTWVQDACYILSIAPPEGLRYYFVCSDRFGCDFLRTYVLDFLCCRYTGCLGETPESIGWSSELCRRISEALS